MEVNPLRNLREGLQKLVEINGLYEVRIETSAARLLTILFATISRERHDMDIAEAFATPEFLCHCVPIHPRQSNIEEDDIRAILIRKVKRLLATRGKTNLVPFEFEQGLHSLGGISVILDE
jgi:hypothetical protein